MKAESSRLPPVAHLFLTQKAGSKADPSSPPPSQVSHNERWVEQHTAQAQSALEYQTLLLHDQKAVQIKEDLHRYDQSHKSNDNPLKSNPRYTADEQPKPQRSDQSRFDSLELKCQLIIWAGKSELNEDRVEDYKRHEGWNGENPELK
jgi:hypothetical protein